MSTPWYVDWTFWTAILAALALVLSQFPPVRQWYKGARLDIEIHPRINITHKVGNPNVTMHIVATNSGGRDLRVKSGKLTLTRDNDEPFTLPVQTYYAGQDLNSQLIFTPFTLKTSNDWAHAVSFLNYFNRDDEVRYSRMESDIRTNISQKAAAPQGELIEADQQYVDPIVAFHDEKFKWLPGEYRAELTIHTDLVTTTKRFQFAIFESQSEDLQNLKNHYRFGSGIYWDRNDVAANVGIDIHEIDA